MSDIVSPAPTSARAYAMAARAAAESQRSSQAPSDDEEEMATGPPLHALPQQNLRFANVPPTQMTPTFGGQNALDAQARGKATTRKRVFFRCIPFPGGGIWCEADQKMQRRVVA